MMLKRYKSEADTLEDLALTDVDSRYPPYVVESTGAQVSMTSAIALVNR